MKPNSPAKLDCTAFIYDRNEFGKPEALKSRTQVKDQSEANQQLHQMQKNNPSMRLFLVVVFTTVAPALLCYFAPMLKDFLVR